MSDSTPHSPEAPEPSAGPAVGQDEWVARHDQHRAGRGGPLGTIEDRLRRVPWWVWLALFLGAFSLFPLFEQSGYVRLVAFDTVLYMLLALGLNVVVGWGGLLDLGFVAFYGIGAYTYAFLDSDQFHVHLPTIVSVPVVVCVGALIGLMVGLPSRRLSGDYLAIVTLFFLQLFQTLTTNGDSVAGHDITGGPFGILNVDPFSFFGHTLVVAHSGVFAVSYLYVALAFFAVVFVALRFVNNSRTGRAWRSLREDSLAAEAMGMPVNRLKLVSFASGAAVAALTGTLFASLTGSVFPLAFYFVLLITVYTMVILGGSGSQAGVVLGALIIGPLLEALRDPNKSRAIFFILLVGGLALAARKSRPVALAAVGLVVFGFVVHAIAGGMHSSWVAGEHAGGLAGFLAYWVVAPAELARWVAPVTYVGAIAAILVVTQLKGTWRLIALVPTLYLCAFVWENVMLAKPEPARYIVLGLILIGLDDPAAERPARRAPGGDNLMAVLELQGVSLSFGGLKVVDGLDIDVEEGSIVSVIGPNGAGKTTLFNLITGIYDPDEGEIRLDGKSIAGLQPHQITGRGISRTFQTLRLFLNMSVKENVMAAAYCHTKAGLFRSMVRTPGMRREEREIEELARDRLSFFGERLMGYRWDQPAYSLSYANRRRLEIARATATNPRILLLDEPAAGMNPKETHEITELIAKLREDGGYTILVIEHDMHVVEGISDRVIALDHGVKIAEGSYESVATNEKVIEAYLGLGTAQSK